VLIPRLRTILMILINAHPIIISPRPLLRQPLLPHLGLAPLLRTANYSLVVLALCFELLDACAAVDVVEAEFEDAVVEDAAFKDVCSATARAGEVVAVVQPELLLSRGGVWHGARMPRRALRSMSAFGFGLGVQNSTV
jgi:hypothetical protein